MTVEHPRGFALLVLLALVAALPARSRADAPEAFRRNRTWVGLSTGYGHSLRSGSDDVANVEYVPVYPRVGISVLGPMGGSSWYRGAVDCMFEPTFLVQVEPHDGFAGGAAIGARYNALALDPLVPFVEIGAGIVNMNLDLEELSDGVGFPLYAGIGAHLFLTEHLAITPQWRFHHLSNGGTGRSNRSLNDSVALVGLTFFLP
jgi:hypothetical protein